MGPRAYRVIFAAISLPLATLAVAHFINHRRAAAPWLRPPMQALPALLAGNSRSPKHCHIQALYTMQPHEQEQEVGCECMQQPGECVGACMRRYDGVPLWNVRGQPLVHELVWVLNFVSFFFLYPSTFNLLEVRLHYPLLPFPLL